jgi:hypothetical protein
MRVLGRCRQHWNVALSQAQGIFAVLPALLPNLDIWTCVVAACIFAVRLQPVCSRCSTSSEQIGMESELGRGADYTACDGYVVCTMQVDVMGGIGERALALVPGMDATTLSQLAWALASLDPLGSVGPAAGVQFMPAAAERIERLQAARRVGHRAGQSRDECAVFVVPERCCERCCESCPTDVDGTRVGQVSGADLSRLVWAAAVFDTEDQALFLGAVSRAASAGVWSRR